MSTDYTQRLEKLSPAQRQLLLKTLREQAARAGESHTIPRRAQQPQEPVPLSFSQERQWLLHQLTPDTPAYNVSVPLRIEGVADVSVLERTLNEIVRRHEILRTSFPTIDGTPMQVVAPAEYTVLPVEDLSGVPADELEEATRQLAGEAAAQLFDLATGPLFRARLIRQAEATYVLVVTMHHIVTDGWSMGRLFQEMAAICRAYMAGEASPLEELKIQYADYAVWQRGWLKDDVLESHLAYWRRQFADAPTVLRLPTDRPRPAVQNYRGALYTHEFPRELHEALKEVNQREGVTMFMTLVAALNVLLFRYSGQDDVVVGSYLANRNRAETESLIGFFVNTIALRTSLAGNPTFRELLARVREVAFGAYAHQELPFERLLEEVQPERSLGHAPLFQVGLNFGNIAAPEIAEFQGVKISRLARGKGVVVGSSQLDLTLDVQGLERGMSASLLYDTTLFDEATIARMLKHFETLLQALVTNPDERIADISLLSAPERHTLLAEWSNAGATHEPTPYVHQLFAQQAARTPERLALVSGAERLSYAELDARAEELARRLRARGVGPESTVGVLLARSVELVVALLGVLKAGAAYVPLDPEYPSERLRLMVATSCPAVVLTGAAETKKAAWLAEMADVVLSVEPSGEETPADERALEAGAAPAGENPAYVIFTSGSTGVPKGVVISHRSLASYTAIAAEEFAITPEDRVLQFTSPSFDTSAEEIFPCLTSGATLVLRDDAMLSSIPTFLRRCEELGITVLDLPTAFWHELTVKLGGEAGLELPPSIRLVIIGGERALPERVQAWQANATERVRLINTYGPTEATIVSTICELTETDDTAELLHEVSIGSAVRHAEIYVLDHLLQPVPVGVAGELYVGGAGLARGYLNRPDLTAAQFIPHPFATRAGARLYRTGDRVSFRPDGLLNFHARVDAQVKVRGFRIDLGDIEAALSECAALREAAVVACETAPGNTRLVAYIVPDDREPVTSEMVRGFLSRKLPSHMIPTSFIKLDQLPLTPNGKIDRKRLAANATDSPTREVAFVAPATPVEELLAEIWSKVLKVAEIGVHDNFFALGGHSLLAMQVVYQLQQALAVQLPLRAFFEEPTVAGLAMAIEEILLEEIEMLSEEEAEYLSLGQ
ncbi:MAG TPA: amino acid adenylation domain-containing protein [Pyrinomonadaceae bacterium]